MNILQDPKQRIDFGNTLYAQGKYDDAIQKYQEACEINPNSSQGYYNWGNALRRQGKLDEAIAKYRKSLEINPNISQAYNNWGLALYDLKKYDEAILKYTKAVEINPSFSQAFNNWGLALDAHGNYEEAILKYKKATELNPRYSEAYYNWGNVLFALEEYEKAGAKYSIAIELNPRYSQAYHNWGVVLSAQEEYEKAIQKYSKAIEIDPYYSDAYNNWALILYDQKKYTEAVQIVAKGVKALSHHPENKIELIKLFNNEMKQDEQELSTSKTEDQKADLRSKMSSIKQILDVLIEQPRPTEHYKEPVAEKRSPSPNKLTSPLEKKEIGDTFQPNAAIGNDPRVTEYYNFMVQEMTVLFGKTFAIKDGKFEEKTDIVLPCVAFAAAFVPALYDVSFDEKIFPLVSKIAPDGISLEDVFIIRKVNKIYQQFMTHFTNQDEMKQIIETIARELTLVRKDSLIADYVKPVHAKTLLKLKQAMARDFVKKYQINTKSEEAAVLDLGILVVLFFLEGLRVEEYTNPTQKANNIAKTVARTIKEFHDELKNEGKAASEWCNVM